jgi:hypothetical protein
MKQIRGRIKWDVSNTKIGDIGNDSLQKPTVVCSNELKCGTNHSSMEYYIARNLNFIHGNSGCLIASWVYQEKAPKKFQDCGKSQKEQKLTLETVEQIQPYDTIYVVYKAMQSFTQDILPNITAPVVLLTGQFHQSRNNLLPIAVTQQVLENPYIIHWFGQNINIYNKLSDKPEKLHPFPMGLQSYAYQPGRPSPLAAYRKAFLRHLANTTKTHDILLAYLNPYTNKARSGVPSLPEPEPLEHYLEKLAHSRFIFSPNGDRPECYRHYEALGLGAIPVTELDPVYYDHLKSGPVAYNTTDWNLTGNVLSAMNLTEFPTVNRFMVLEEYWIEHVETIVGRSLLWWDHIANRRAKLANFLVDWSLAASSHNGTAAGRARRR